MFNKRIKRSVSIAIGIVIMATSIPMKIANAETGDNNETKSFINEKITKTEYGIHVETEVNIEIDRNDYSSDEEYLDAMYNELDELDNYIYTEEVTQDGEKTMPSIRQARAYIGQTRTDTVKISNATILSINGIAGSAAKINFIKKLVLKLVSVSLLTTVGQFMAVCSLIAGVNQLSGYKGFAVDITSKYGKHKAYDTDQWVEYLGWGVIGRKGYRYK